MSTENENNVMLVGAVEEQQVSRAILLWLNGYTSKPVNVKFEYLPKDGIGLALAAAQAPMIIQSYVDGSYEAQYQFSIIHRCQPIDDDERLSAEEMLNSFGDWCESTAPPSLGEGKTVTEIKKSTSASILARYEDGSEDYNIQMTLQYEVEKE